MDFEHVLVVGAGQMGGGIAQVVAASGRRVSLYDAFPGATERGLAAMRKSLEKLAEKGGSDPDEVLARVAAVDELVSADLMIEAVVEDAAVKEDLFRRADGILPDGAILASNTSSIPITSLAAVTGRPDRVIGMHFFNPVPVLKLVEVIRAVQTSDETAAAITKLAEDLGKVPAQANDFPGFVSNRILMPFINEAAYALLEGVAEPEAIDTIAKLGFAHPMGPLALADLIGLDTCVAIMDVLHEGLGNPKYAPCPLLRQYVQAGRLGRKSGRGFYEYRLDHGRSAAARGSRPPIGTTRRSSTRHSGRFFDVRRTRKRAHGHSRSCAGSSRGRRSSTSSRPRRRQRACACSTTASRSLVARGRRGERSSLAAGAAGTRRARESSSPGSLARLRGDRALEVGVRVRRAPYLAALLQAGFDELTGVDLAEAERSGNRPSARTSAKPRRSTTSASTSRLRVSRRSRVGQQRRTGSKAEDDAASRLTRSRELRRVTRSRRAQAADHGAVR